MMHAKAVRQFDSAQRAPHAGAQKVARQRPGRVHATLASAREHDLLHGLCGPRWRARGCPACPRRAKAIVLSGPLRGGDQRELQRCSVDLARDRRSIRLDGGRAVAERDDRCRQLVHPVSADQHRDRRVREPGVQPCGDPGGVRDRDQLGERRARVPVDVAVTTLAVAPAGPPRNAGHDDHRRTRSRRRADPNQRMVERVVPVHPGRHARSFWRRHAQLERNRPPAHPAARNSQVLAGRSIVRTTPAVRWSRRERAGRSSSLGATPAVPASTAVAEAVVGRRSRGSGTRASGSAYRL